MSKLWQWDALTETPEVSGRGLRGGGLGSPYDAEGPGHFPEDAEPDQAPPRAPGAPWRPCRFVVGQFVYCFHTRANEQVLAVEWEKPFSGWPGFWRVSVAGYSAEDINFNAPVDSAPFLAAVQVGHHCWDRVPRGFVNDGDATWLRFWRG